MAVPRDSTTISRHGCVVCGRTYMFGSSSQNHCWLSLNFPVPSPCPSAEVGINEFAIKLYHFADLFRTVLQGGEVINFDIAGKTFAWNFDGAVSSFKLNRIAPQGLLDHVVVAYVAPNPLYEGH